MSPTFEVAFVPILLQKSASDQTGSVEAVVAISLSAARPHGSGGFGADARDAHATHAAAGGGLATSLARRRRFWAMAASVNSNCAPRGPRRRSRPSLRMRLR